MGESPTLMKRSQKSAEVVVAEASRRAAKKKHGEGPNEKDSHETCRLEGQCIRSLGNRGARGRGAVKLHWLP